MTKVNRMRYARSQAKSFCSRNVLDILDYLDFKCCLRISAEEIYENLCRYIMTEVQLNDNGYPRPGDLRGTCQFMTEQPRPNADKTK